MKERYYRVWAVKADGTRRLASTLLRKVETEGYVDCMRKIEPRTRERPEVEEVAVVVLPLPARGKRGAKGSALNDRRGVLERIPAFRVCVDRADGSRIVLREFLPWSDCQRKAALINRDSANLGVLATVEPCDDLPALLEKTWRLAELNKGSRA